MTSGERVANTPEMVARFTAIFQRHPTPALIANLITRVDQTEVAGRAYPLTFNDRGQAGNCYICNPVTAYIDYALEETRNFGAHPALRHAVRGLIRACAPLVRASGIDHQVQINNWLLSTNPMPDLDLAAAAALRDRLTAAHPDRALVLRSLNDMADGASLANLRAAGFRLLPARQIYLHAADGAQHPPSNDMKRDLAMIARSGLHVVGNDGFTMADYDRSTTLYAMLYIQKYTPLNPAYTALYLAEMHRAGLIALRGLRAPDSGDLVAVTGLFENGRTLTQPIVGYDTTLPLKAGLYRMAMAMAQDHARQSGLFFNMSAGAAAFKRHRQALPAIEYTAVFADHLPRGQRIALRVMEEVLTRTGIPLLRRFEL
jgi:hypothetical protein